MYTDAAESVIRTTSSVRSECHDEDASHRQLQRRRPALMNRNIIDTVDDNDQDSVHNGAIDEDDDDNGDDDEDDDDDEIHSNKKKKRRTAIAGTAPIVPASVVDFAADASNAASELQSRQMVEHLLQEFAPSVVLRALLATPHHHQQQQQQQQQHSGGGACCPFSTVSFSESTSSPSPSSR
jgi:hypothetical protein